MAFIVGGFGLFLILTLMVSLALTKLLVQNGRVIPALLWSLLVVLVAIVLHASGVVTGADGLQAETIYSMAGSIIFVTLVSSYMGIHVSTQKARIIILTIAALVNAVVIMVLWFRHTALIA